MSHSGSQTPLGNGFPAKLCLALNPVRQNGGQFALPIFSGFMGGPAAPHTELLLISQVS